MMEVVAPAERSVHPDVEAWYRSHHAELVRLAALAVGNVSTAEELVHDVFANLARRRPRLDDPDRPLPYLRTAVLNRCRSRLRRLAVGRAATTFVGARPEHPPATPDDVTVDRATRAEVLAAVRRLPRRQRDVVLLRYWLDLPEAEIAATLGVAPGTVKTSAHRALRALAPLLEDLR